MTLEMGMVNVDALDPDALGRWWCDRLDARVLFHEPGESLILHSPTAGVALAFQRADEPTPGRNRLHLDLQSADRVADVGRLVAAGAEHVGTHEAGGPDFGGMTWDVLRDPEGNLFCVADKLPHPDR